MDTYSVDHSLLDPRGIRTAQESVIQIWVHRLRSDGWDLHSLVHTPEEAGKAVSLIMKKHHFPRIEVYSGR